jgi:hypothetical protein
MKKLSSFYVWFTALGGEVSNTDYSNIDKSINAPIFVVSSIKHRANEFKQQHNYKFSN